jgi:hypothetical protein
MDPHALDVYNRSSSMFEAAVQVCVRMDGAGGGAPSPFFSRVWLLSVPAAVCCARASL